MRLLPALFVVFALPAAAAERVDFNRDIRPIISGKCFACHGPDEESREADLRLDVRAEALKERDGVRAIVPGDLKASELLLRVTSTDRDEVMPPPKEGHPLEPKEVALLKQWIEQGAE
ncbi:MAG TPA: c-type cytochrome domain-containing protein, partial [Chthoniobacteraceae bacterium]|nr:c-type cytochrome domain-containing protein [Chthoniobacteraceae bacterium]